MRSLSLVLLSVATMVAGKYLLSPASALFDSSHLTLASPPVPHPSVPAAHAEHKPTTADEFAALANLKAASYLCAPQIAAYNAERQRSWAQKVLGGSPNKDKELFVEGGWEDIAQKTKGIESDEGKKIMACNAVEGSKIRNHTCVLGELSLCSTVCAIRIRMLKMYSIYLHSSGSHRRSILPRSYSLSSPSPPKCLPTSQNQTQTVGHPIRHNMAELEPGLLFLMNIGVIDVNTCEPVPNILVDIWVSHHSGR